MPLSLSRLSIIFVTRALLRIAADCYIYVFIFSAAPILNNKTRLFAIKTNCAFKILYRH